MRQSDTIATELGELLQEFVNRVSHRHGTTLSLLTEESVTLQQVLVLRRLQEAGGSTPSGLAALMRMSLPALSQMIDRLSALGLVARDGSVDDRRRKQITTTARGRAVLARVRGARVAEFAAGTASLSPPVRAELVRVLRSALKELPGEVAAALVQAAPAPQALPRRRRA